MLKTVYKIDENGFIVDRYVEEVSITKYITTDLPDGLFRPRFVNGIWVENATKEEIDEIINVPKQPTPEERIQRLEDALLLQADTENGGIL